MNFSIRRRAESIVDITPLIDIIFQLVLFFMVSTTFVTNPGFEVDLPRSSADTILRDKKEIEVWMTKEGAIFLDDQPQDWGSVVRRFTEAAKGDPNTLIILKADKEVSHGRVTAILGLARSLGLNRLAIATEADATPGGAPATPP